MEGKVLYPELSFSIAGLSYRIFKELGYGLREKYYQDAYANSLEKSNIPFNRERHIIFKYDGAKIGSCFLDFVVKDVIVVELKVRHHLGYADIQQVMSYLKAGNFKLAIILYFTKEGVKFRRVLNSK